MDVSYINPILNSFASVLPQLGLANVRKKGMSLKGRFIESPGVMIIVGIIGDIKGNVIYGLSLDDAKKIASTMMMGMPVDTFDELAQSAISELTNMLTATVATNFSNDNISINELRASDLYCVASQNQLDWSEKAIITVGARGQPQVLFSFVVLAWT
jgi:chemotaxis protein CheX